MAATTTVNGESPRLTVGAARRLARVFTGAEKLECLCVIGELHAAAAAAEAATAVARAAAIR